MLAKTVKAREALEAGKAGAVDLRDRRILILADGRRTRAELMSMLGADAAPSIDRLMREGYLWNTDASHVVAPATAPVPIPAPPPQPASAPEPPTSKRRSLVAAKMYLVDMLQLQRSPAAVELRLAIQSTSDPAQILERLLDALAYLVANTQPSYGERVRARFAEVVPDEALPRVREFEDQSARVNAGAFQSPLTTAASGQ